MGQIYGVNLLLSNILLVVMIVYYFLGLFIYLLLVLGVVLFHEISHVVVARLLDVPVKDVELFLLGGVVRIDDSGEFYFGREVIIALAGPIFNLLLAGVTYVILLYGLGNQSYISFIFKINILMGMVNLLPVLPLDGGRVLRAYLAGRKGFLFATRGAAIMGQILAVGLFFFGTWDAWQCWSNFHWILIGAYLFYAAGRERKLAFFSFIKYLTRKKNRLKSAGVLPCVTIVAMKKTKLKQVVYRLVPDKYHIIIIIDDEGEILRKVTEHNAIDVALNKGMNLTMEAFLKS